MGENMCWMWVVTSKVENTYQNKVCMQGRYVWGMFWVQQNYPSMFMTNKVMTLQQQVPKPKVGLLYNNYFLLEPCHECMCDELINKALDLIKCLDYYW